MVKPYRSLYSVPRARIPFKVQRNRSLFIWFSIVSMEKMAKWSAWIYLWQSFVLGHVYGSLWLSCNYTHIHISINCFIGRLVWLCTLYTWNDIIHCENFMYVEFSWVQFSSLLLFRLVLVVLSTLFVLYDPSLPNNIRTLALFLRIFSCLGESVCVYINSVTGRKLFNIRMDL